MTYFYTKELFEADAMSHKNKWSSDLYFLKNLYNYIDGLFNESLLMTNLYL